MRLEDFSLSSIHFPCCQKTFHPLFVRLGVLLSTSVCFQCDWETFRQLPAIFCAEWRPSVNFRQLLLQSGDHPSTFHTTGRPSVNFRQNSVWPGDLPSTSVKPPCFREIFRQLPSTFCAAGRHCSNYRQLSVPPINLPSTSVNSPCSLKTFRELSVRPGEFSSTFVYFLCCQEACCQLPSTFHAAGRHSVNFHQLSV